MEDFSSFWWKFSIASDGHLSSFKAQAFIAISVLMEEDGWASEESFSDLAKKGIVEDFVLMTKSFSLHLHELFLSFWKTFYGLWRKNLERKIAQFL